MDVVEALIMNIRSRTEHSYEMCLKPKTASILLLWQIVRGLCSRREGNAARTCELKTGFKLLKRSTANVEFGSFVHESFPTLRPQMSTVLSMIDGRALVQVASAKGKASYHGDTGFKYFGKLSQDSQTSSISTDGWWTGSSTSHQSRIKKDPVSENRTLSDSTDKLIVLN